MSDIPADAETNLVLSVIGLPPQSARGIKQSLTAIDEASQQRRDVNGNLVDLSVEQYRKYITTIECSDMEGPAMDGIWPGQIVVVDCVKELAYLSYSGAPERPVVEDSERVKGDWTFYRPRLTMMVRAYEDDTEEWEAVVSWRMTLEEI